MYRIFSIIFIFSSLISYNQLLAQNGNRGYVSGISLDVKASQVLITYNLESETSHNVGLSFIDKKFNYYFPDSIWGDIGPGVTPGKQKTIYWDISKDRSNMPELMKPDIMLDGRFNDGIEGGPRNALLSMAIPGLGDYFVADHRQMRIKPWMKTIATYALIGTGIILHTQRYREEGHYERYVRGKWFEQGGNWSWEQVVEYDWMEGDIVYKWFKGDAEVFYVLGGTLWFADIVWVISRGSLNKRNKESRLKQGISHDLRFGVDRYGPGFNYTLTF